MKIQLLDNSTINKIAAGEVVERPSSVVKELIENSIDAGSSSITIEIKDGGTALIRITDNGCGISKEDVKTAFIRHATSKIEKIDDLEKVCSLGFRGEALASIASISMVEMTTKVHKESTGTYIEISGGNYGNIQDIGSADGTSVIVKNIFYNVPARRKFLKKVAIESGYISDIINKMALGHPEISFKFINNGNIILHTSGNSNLETAMFHVYGKEISSKMIALDYKKDGFKLKGLIGKPELSRGNRNYENLFINGRFIKSNIISSAVEDAYKTRLLIGKFPVFVLNLEIDLAMVDVNVHPTKLEVRFQNEDEIYEFIYNAVNDCFKDKTLITEADWGSKPTPQVQRLMEENEHIISVPKVSIQEKPDEKDNAIVEKDKFVNDVIVNHKPINSTLDVKLDNLPNENLVNKLPCNNIVNQGLIEYENNTNTEKLNHDKVIFKEKNEPNKIVKEEKGYVPFFDNYKIIGQVFNTYWFIEQNDSIFVIDQHAAHERILFEELYSKFQKENVVSQRLLQPIVVSLNLTEREILKDNIEIIKKFGFEIDEFGESSYAIRSVPFIFKAPTSVKFFTDIIDILGNSNLSNIYETKILAIATMSCKAAVKANNKLSFQEAVAMIESLLSLENPFTCPHGRPTIIEMSKYELEKKFKRVQ